MPIAALLAPALAAAILPEGLGALGTALGTGAIGAGLGAGSGALFSELTGGKPGAGALSGAIGGAAAPLGGAAGSALGVGETAGSIAGGAAGGAIGAKVTGANPLVGALEGGVGPAIGAISPGGVSGTSATSSAAPAAAPTGSPMPTGGAASASGITGGIGTSGTVGGGVDNIGGLTSDPAAFLDANNNRSFGLSAGVDANSPVGGGEDFGSKLMGLLKSNPALLLSAAPLAMSLFRSNSTSPAEGQLESLAGADRNQAAALTAPIQTGVLPPGAQQAVDASKAANRAGVSSTFGNLGLAGSTMEQQAMQGVNRNAAAQTFQIADTLLGQGMAAQGRSENVYSDLLKTQLSEDEQFQRSLMLFASGLAGGGRAFSGSGS